MGKLYIKWEEVVEYVKETGDRVHAHYASDIEARGIFTFYKGGATLAAMLSYYLEEKYGWDVPMLLSPANGCIIIDDILDTGITMKKYSDLKGSRKYFLTTMFIKDFQLEGTAQFQCTLDYYKCIKVDEWIVFPWEMDEEK